MGGTVGKRYLPMAFEGGKRGLRLGRSIVKRWALLSKPADSAAAHRFAALARNDERGLPHRHAARSEAKMRHPLPRREVLPEPADSAAACHSVALARNDESALTHCH